MANSSKDTELIEKILQDPLLLRKLSEKVYRLLIDDLYIQCDRFPKR
jgi:hypothetical protein